MVHQKNRRIPNLWKGSLVLSWSTIGPDAEAGVVIQCTGTSCVAYTIDNRPWQYSGCLSLFLYPDLTRVITFARLRKAMQEKRKITSAVITNRIVYTYTRVLGWYITNQGEGKYANTRSKLRWVIWGYETPLRHCKEKKIEITCTSYDHWWCFVFDEEKGFILTRSSFIFGLSSWATNFSRV